MEQNKRLQTIGLRIFGWVASIVVLSAMTSAFRPNLSDTQFMVSFTAQLLRSQSMVSVMFLAFLCFAIRPMGLWFRSRIFGVSLGLGLSAITDLVEPALLASSWQLHTYYNLINGLVRCVTVTIWLIYFALPEPPRRNLDMPPGSTLCPESGLDEDDPDSLSSGAMRFGES